MKKFLITFLITALVVSVFSEQEVSAQNVNDGIYVKENIPAKANSLQGSERS